MRLAAQIQAQVERMRRAAGGDRVQDALRPSLIAVLM